MKRKNSFVAAEVPTAHKRGVRSINRELIVSFVASGLKSAMVTGNFKHSTAKASALRKATKELNMDVTVTEVSGKVYLTNNTITA